METKYKIMFGLVLCIGLIFVVSALEVQTVYNPFAQGLDYVRAENASNSSQIYKNMTIIDCIHFDSGGKVCGST